jgi:hypothetical protein
MSPANNASASSARFMAGRINRRIKRWSSSTRRSPWHRFAPYLGTVLALSLFGGALYLLHRQVAGTILRMFAKSRGEERRSNVVRRARSTVRVDWPGFGASH